MANQLISNAVGQPKKIISPSWGGIPDECKMSITLPSFQNDFYGSKNVTVNLNVSGNPGDLVNLSSDTPSRSVVSETISLICKSDISNTIQATYRPGGTGIASKPNKLLSLFSSFGITSFREATLNYQGSSISGIRLEFVAGSFEGDQIDVRKKIASLYKAVLPTFLRKGKGKGGSISLQIDGKPLGETLDSLKRESGYIVSTLATAAEESVKLLGKVDNLIGLDLYQAPLSYSPWDLDNIQGTVTLQIGNYFRSDLMVITDLQVTYSREMTEIENGDGEREVVPLYAEGGITFEFARPLSNLEYANCFGKISADEYFIDVTTRVNHAVSGVNIDDIAEEPPSLFKSGSSGGSYV